MNDTTIDRKFIFKAVNPCTEKTYTQENALILCAKDRAVPAALKAYHKECMKLGCEPGHLVSINLMIERVETYQTEIENRIPDTDPGCEQARCLLGEL